MSVEPENAEPLLADAAVTASLDDAPRDGLPSFPAYVQFRDAARKLKAAESAVQDARAEYAEAVKKLSEEAVR